MDAFDLAGRMKGYEIAQLVIVAAAACAAAPFLGRYMAALYSGAFRAPRPLARVEAAFYKALGADPGASMGWKEYALSILAFSSASIALLFLILVGQGRLPLDPMGFPGMKWDLALSTAISFVTNTNWQAYSGEASLSYFSQAAGLAVQNFLSAAVGMSVAAALARGIAAAAAPSDAARPSPDGSAPGVGNFWVDMTRSVLYLLLPLSLVLAVALAGQGVVQSLSGYVPAVSLEGKSDLIPLGPAASQVAIKHLGTNGGGFFGPNSSFPFENPTVASDLLEKIALILIPFAFPFCYGRMVGSRRHGRAIFLVMLSLLAIAIAGSLWSELSLGTIEGKELRFGEASSALFSVLTTITSCGAVNAMHDSLSPLAGMVAMFDIMVGEVVFGGVGSGLYGMAALVVVTVFIAALMVGRSPEYLGKKIEAREVRLAMAAVMVPNLLILGLSAIASSIPAGLSSLANRGPHGLSEILYAYSSGAGNNGSAFGGLAANTIFYNLTMAAAMLVGRFGVMIPMLALGGGLAAKRTVAQGVGSLRTDTLVFAALLLSVVVLVGGLTHFPALTLGPILEHFLMIKGVSI